MLLNKTRLYTILTALSEKELKQFGDFVKSPYFNKNERIVELLRVLLDDRHEWSSLTKKDLFRALFLTEVYKESKINKLIAMATELAVQFLAQIEYERSSYLSLSVLKASSQRGIEKVFEAEFKKLEKKQKKQVDKDDNYYFIKGEMIKRRYTHKFLSKRTTVQIDKLEESIHAFEVSFILKYCSDICQLLTESALLKQQADLDFLHHLINYLEKNELSYQPWPAIKIYRLLIIAFLSDEGYTYFEELLQNLYAVEEELLHQQPSVLYQLYGFISDIGVSALNVEGQKHARSVFGLYQVGLERRYAYDGQILRYPFYKNVIVMACRVGEYSIAKNILEEYKLDLPKNVRAQVYNFCKVIICFMEKDYKETLALLSTVKFTDVYDAMNAKMMQIKSYYALGNDNQVESSVENLRLMMLRDKKIAQKRKQPTNTFVKYIRRFIKLKLNYSKQVEKYQHRLELLYVEIEQSPKPMMNKEWLLQQIKQEFLVCQGVN